MKDETQETEVVDLEQYAKLGKKPPEGRTYRFRVDREFFETRKPKHSGREILLFAQKDPAKWLLNQKVKGAVIPIGPDEIVDLTVPGLERFLTLPKDQTEGELRKEFALPESDVELLDKGGYAWECVQEGKRRWLLVHEFGIPEGYLQKQVTVAVLIPPGYPSGQLDMVFVSPALTLLSNRTIQAVQHVEMIRNCPFQRWSRHYTPTNPWRSDFNVVTHLILARSWFARESEREAA